MPKAVTITPEAREVLARCIVEGTADRPTLKLPPEQLDRKLYEAVAKVLKALGGKWNKGAGGFTFDRPFEGELAEALASGKAIDVKRSAEQFFTPPALARRMVEALGIGPGTHVLEPSAGEGRLVRAAMDAGAEFFTIVELDDRLATGLVELLGHHSGGIWAGDFMAWSPSARAPIDVALMNPPFSRNQDIAHVERALGFVRPGGKLAAIMSPHFTFAQDEPSRRFRELIGYPDSFRLGEGSGVELANASVELLPAGTFQAEGTGVNAVLVIIEKAA